MLLRSRRAQGIYSVVPLWLQGLRERLSTVLRCVDVWSQVCCISLDFIGKIQGFLHRLDCFDCKKRDSACYLPVHSRRRKFDGASVSFSCYACTVKRIFWLEWIFA